MNGALDPVGGEIFNNELARLCEQLRLVDLHHGVERTIQQRRADALVGMAIRSATAPADGLRPRPLFTVTIGIEPFNHLCETAAATIIAPGLLMPLLTDAEFERIIYDPPNRNIAASRRRSFTVPSAASSKSATGTANSPTTASNPPHDATSTTSPPTPAPDHLPVHRTDRLPHPQPHHQKRRQNPPTTNQRTGDPLPCEHCAHLWAQPTPTTPVPPTPAPHPPQSDARSSTSHVGFDRVVGTVAGS